MPISFEQDWREIRHLLCMLPWSSTMEGFQVDIILNSLKELQEGKRKVPLSDVLQLFLLLSPEKGRNERILAEEYHKRKELEAELEEATSKYRVVSEKHAKVKEAVNVTELKVSQIQAQVKMYEHYNIPVKEVSKLHGTTVLCVPLMVTTSYPFWCYFRHGNTLFS